MDLNIRPSGCVKVYADSLRKTMRLLTMVLSTRLWEFRQLKIL